LAIKARNSDNIIKMLEKVVDSSKIIFNKLTLDEYSLLDKLKTRFRKTFLLLITFVGLSWLYYFYIKVNKSLRKFYLIPVLESDLIDTRLSLTNIDHSTIMKSGVIKLFTFHFLFLMSVLCLLRTLFSNPGYLENDYVSLKFNLS
jgi:hypothetical protein